MSLPTNRACFGNEIVVNYVFVVMLRLPFSCQGDARYLITSSKDQSIKLWDMRRFSDAAGVTVGI